jgi:hypothetical protein
MTRISTDTEPSVRSRYLIPCVGPDLQKRGSISLELAKTPEERRRILDDIQMLEEFRK